MTKLTKEWLHQQIAEIESLGLSETDSNTLAAFRVALAGMGSEQKSKAAVATLEHHGFTWHGGDLWKPPLGLPPEFVSNDRAELQEYRKAAPVEINDEMAFAFCHALSDGAVGADEVEDIKTGLRAAFANITTPQPAPAVEAVPVVPDENGNLPCPFCGGKCDEEEWRGTSPDIGSIFGPGCEECGATARNIAEWNHRAAMLPDCWVMVPVELTPDMRAAWDLAPNTDDDDHNMQVAYRAMIAAAPQQEV